MDRLTAVHNIREGCKTIASAVTGLHPLVPMLGDKETQDEIYKALFALTREVEIVKKQLLKLERRDESSAL